MQNLILTVGLPRSGKTSWALKSGFPVVNPDSVRLAIHGHPYIGVAEELVWTMAHYMVKALLLYGYEHVVIDATNTTQTRRFEWLELAAKRHTLVWYKNFKVHPDVCKQRAVIDGMTDLLPVIDKMADEIDYPEYQIWLDFVHEASQI